jgi:hypothetical protein
MFLIKLMFAFEKDFNFVLAIPFIDFLSPKKMAMIFLRKVFFKIQR